MIQYRNKQWHDLKEKVKKRDNHKCLKCGRSDKDSVLQVHHLRYQDGKEVWESPMDDLVTVCKYCHAVTHGIIEPNKGWILEYSYDNEDCSYTCERKGCNTPIRYEQHIYHPNFGNKIVGSECVNHLTKEDQNIIKRITAITCSANIFTKKFNKSDDSFCFRIFRGVKARETRSRFYKKYPCLTADYRSSSIDIIDNDGRFLCLLWVKKNDSYHRYSYYVDCENINQCMKFSYYMIRGIKTDTDKNQDIKILKTLISNYSYKRVDIIEKSLLK